MTTHNKLPIANELPMGFPVLKNFYDVIIHQNELIRAINNNPHVDYVYMFPHLFSIHAEDPDLRGPDPECVKKAESFFTERWNWCSQSSISSYEARLR